jgi:hypothetical protein
MSATGQWASADYRPEKGKQYRPNAPEFDENVLRNSLDELLNLNSRCGRGYADLH